MIKDKVVIITGASSGIGEATAVELASAALQARRIPKSSTVQVPPDVLVHPT